MPRQVILILSQQLPRTASASWAQHPHPSLRASRRTRRLRMRRSSRSSSSLSRRTPQPRARRRPTRRRRLPRRPRQARRPRRAMPSRVSMKKRVPGQHIGLHCKQLRESMVMCTDPTELSECPSIQEKVVVGCHDRRMSEMTGVRLDMQAGVQVDTPCMCAARARAQSKLA